MNTIHRIGEKTLTPGRKRSYVSQTQDEGEKSSSRIEFSILLPHLFHAPPKIRNLLIVRKLPVNRPYDNEHERVGENCAENCQREKKGENGRHVDHLRSTCRGPN